MDIYYLIKDSSLKSVNNFKEHFLKNHVGTSQYFEYPQFRSETEFQTDNENEMVNFLLTNKSSQFRLYFRASSQDEIQIGMIFFNIDGSLTLGLTLDEEHKEKYRELMTKNFEVLGILEAYEVLPPDNIDDFLKLCSPSS